MGKGGGGGASGRVSNGYISSWHSYILSGYGTNTSTDSMYLDGDTWAVDIDGTARAVNGANVAPPPRPGSMLYIVNDLISTNSPYFEQDSYDPDTELTTLASEMTDLITLVDDSKWPTNATGHTNFDSFVDAIASTIDRDVVNLLDSHIDTAANDYEDDVEHQQIRSVNRIAGSFAEINAVNGTAFMMGISLLEFEKDREVNRFRSSLKLNKDRVRANAILTGGSQVLEMFSQKVRFKALAENAYQEFLKTKVVVKNEEQDRNLHIDSSDLMWDLELLSNAANVLGSPAGSVIDSGPKSPNKGVTNAVAAMAGGASAGQYLATAAGGAGGPVAMGIGAMVGLTAALLD